MASTASDAAATRPPKLRPIAFILSPKRDTPSEAVTKSPASARLRRTNHRDVEVLDLLAQRIAIEPQKAGGTQLITACCPQSERQQRALDLGNDTIVHAVGRQPVAMRGEQRLQMAVDRVGERDVVRGVTVGRRLGLGRD